MVDQATVAVEPIAADRSLSATARFQGLFSGIAQWKGERTDLIIGLLDAWLADENAIVREKFRRHVVERLLPLLTTIVRDGHAAGEFTVTSPDHAARVVVALVLGANETASQLYVHRQAGSIGIDEVERTLGAFGEGFERILGARPGSFELVDPAIIRRWF